MEKKKLVRTTTPTSSVAPEQVISALNKTTTTAEKPAVKRLNMDMPQDLYDLIESEIGETGQTIKGFFVALTRQHFREKGKIS